MNYQNENLIDRWPLHPKPLWEESLSSWLHRLAEAYWVTLDEWFENIFSEKVPDDLTLDTNPSEKLIQQLSLGTGLSKNRLHQMTIKSYAPWIIDNLNNCNNQFNLFTDYLTQTFSVLPWRPCREKFCCRTILTDKIVPWLNRSKLPMICIKCLESDPIPYLRIFWRLTLLGGCPKHMIRLTEVPYYWQDGLKLKKSKNKIIKATDHEVLLADTFSFQAITTGTVLLSPDRQLNAGIYCRWLRFLISELFCLSHNREDIDHIWYAAGESLKLGLVDNTPYENLSLYDRYRTLKVLGFILKELPIILSGEELDLKSRKEVVSMPKRVWKSINMAESQTTEEIHKLGLLL